MNNELIGQSFLINDFIELDRLVQELIEDLQINDSLYFKNSNQLIVKMDGDLATGKTTFVSRFVRFLDPKIEVQSPTYSFINRYKTSFLEIVHVDLYRLQSDDEVQSIGFWDLFETPFEEPKKIIFIEWATKIPENDWPIQIPCLNLKFEKIAEQSDSHSNQRKIYISI